MSFVNYTKDLKAKTSLQETESNMSMRIDVLPVSLGTAAETTRAKQDKQSEVMEQIKLLGKDLFHTNNTAVTTRASNKFYQTADLYGCRLSLEKLVPLLKENDLTLRVNALRDGNQSHVTCMELTHKMLSNMMDGAPDSKQEKCCNLMLKTAGEQGTMYVGVKVKRSQHFIQKVDYEINALVDSQLHINSS